MSRAMCDQNGRRVMGEIERRRRQHWQRQLIDSPDGRLTVTHPADGVSVTEYDPARTPSVRDVLHAGRSEPTSGAGT